MKCFLSKSRNKNPVHLPVRPAASIANVIGIICLTAIIAFNGCKKDFEFDKVKALSWNPDLALPLVHDSLTLKQALTQSGAEDHFYIDENGDISILYYFNPDAFRIMPGDLIRILPVTFPFRHTVTQPEQNTLAQSDLSLTAVPFSLGLTSFNQDTRIDRLLVREGTIIIKTNHTFSNSGYLTFRILNATLNGNPFSFTISPFAEGGNQTLVDISNVSLDLSSSPGVLNGEVDGLLKKSDQPVAGDEISVDLTITIPKIGYFEGFLGKQVFDQLSDTVRVDVFNNAYALGEVYFVDPQASIKIINSIGIPADITVEKLVSINNASGVTMDIASQLGAGAFFQIPSPLVTATQPVEKSMFYTNENTGNVMNDFYNLKPDNVAFQIKAVINPSAKQVNFFYDTSSFHADIRVKLPLYGHFDHLTFQDTFDLVIDKPEELEYLLFRTQFTNGLPLSSMIQVYFTDENYNKKDSLTGNDRILVEEAPVDPSTHLPYPGMYGYKDTTFYLGPDRLLNLKNVKKALLKAVMHSTDEGQVNVKFRADQMLKVNFSAKAKVHKMVQP
jgi:hypothetical protein